MTCTREPWKKNFKMPSKLTPKLATKDLQFKFKVAGFTVFFTHPLWASNPLGGRDTRSRWKGACVRHHTTHSQRKPFNNLRPTNPAPTKLWLPFTKSGRLVFPPKSKVATSNWHWSLRAEANCFLQGFLSRWQTWGQPCQGLGVQWDFPMLSRCWCWMLLLSIWAPSHDQLQVNEAGDEYREPHLAYHQQGVKGRW